MVLNTPKFETTNIDLSNQNFFLLPKENYGTRTLKLKLDKENHNYSMKNSSRDISTSTLNITS